MTFQNSYSNNSFILDLQLILSCLLPFISLSQTSLSLVLPQELHLAWYSNLLEFSFLPWLSPLTYRYLIADPTTRKLRPSWQVYNLEVSSNSQWWLRYLLQGVFQVPTPFPWSSEYSYCLRLLIAHTLQYVILQQESLSVWPLPPFCN